MDNHYDTIISYDITTNNPGVHSAIKDAMINKGYFDRFTNKASKNIIYLPNTTLWKKGINSKTAHTDLQACIDAWNKGKTEKDKLERCVADEFTSRWYGIAGIAHANVCQAPEK